MTCRISWFKTIQENEDILKSSIFLTDKINSLTQTIQHLLVGHGSRQEDIVQAIR